MSNKQKYTRIQYPQKRYARHERQDYPGSCKIVDLVEHVKEDVRNATRRFAGRDVELSLYKAIRQLAEHCRYAKKKSEQQHNRQRIFDQLDIPYSLKVMKDQRLQSKAYRGPDPGRYQTAVGLIFPKDPFSPKRPATVDRRHEKGKPSEFDAEPMSSQPQQQRRKKIAYGEKFKHPLNDQHRIAVAVKSIPRGDRVPIRIHYKFVTAKS